MAALPSLNQFKIHVSDSIGDVSALQWVPARSRAVLVLAHGAGAGMDHAFMVSLAEELLSKSIGTIRFNFTYMEQGKRRPDFPAVAEKTVQRLIEVTGERCPDVPLFVGGKSFGGRMSSQYLSRECPSRVSGIVFFGFPLHPAGAPSTKRAVHLSQIKIPMLFLQGTRDALADLKLLREVVKGLPTATLKTLEGADHSFKASKKLLVDVLADGTSDWIDQILKNK
jgi:predicted alpha/beta-hydrolase family hydrolase